MCLNESRIVSAKNCPSSSRSRAPTNIFHKSDSLLVIICRFLARVRPYYITLLFYFRYLNYLLLFWQQKHSFYRNTSRCLLRFLNRDVQICDWQTGCGGSNRVPFVMLWVRKPKKRSIVNLYLYFLYCRKLYYH